MIDAEYDMNQHNPVDWSKLGWWVLLILVSWGIVVAPVAAVLWLAGWL